MASQSPRSDSPTPAAVATWPGWPWWLCLLCLFGLMGGVLAAGAWLDAGRFVYPLDDTYIHLAMADNLAQHGVWGVTPYAFSSSSSSPLWTCLLAGSVLLFGSHDAIPLIWNLLLASLICLLLYRRLTGLLSSGAIIFGFLVLFALFIPLPALIHGGLEHNLHTLLSLGFAFSAARTLASDRPDRHFWRLPIMAVFLVAARYEGLFLVVTVAGLLIVRRRFRQALATILLGLSGIGAIGGVALMNGWHFFPNSLLVKGNLPDLNSWSGFFRFASTGPIQLVTNPHLLALFAVALSLWLVMVRQRIADSRPALYELSIFLATCAMHLQFARTGWLFRYEAYLVAMGLAAVVRPIHGLRSSLERPWFRRLGIGLATFAFCLLAIRAVASISLLPVSSRNIYQQQIQTGLFLKKYYAGQTVALNDIGAPNHLADIHCIDLYGLADIEVLDLKRAGRYDSREIERIAHRAGVQIAILYEEWFNTPAIGGLPTSWIRVSRWTIPDNETCAFADVSLFATNRKAAVLLSDRVRQFATQLPVGVRVELFDF